ncbi:MAG: hypothetical protein ABH828_05525 [archaeon]
MEEIISFEVLPEKLRSKYLDDFYLEKLLIENVVVDLEAKEITGDVTVNTDVKGHSNNDFRWSSLTAYRAATQLALAYAGIYLKKDKDDIGEVFQTESSSVTRKPISDKKAQVNVSIKRVIEKNSHLIGDLEYQVNDSNFSGTIRFVVGFDNDIKLSKKEKKMINMWTFLDTAYHFTGIKKALGVRSMYDNVLKDVKLKTWRNIYSTISKNKIDKTIRLIKIRDENNGEIPTQYEQMCNLSICSRTRFKVAYKH